MFTGIVEELGRLESLDNGRLRIGATQVLDDVAIGESIAVNGCCLTVVGFGDDWWEADVSDETISRTSLAMVQPGDGINLERAVRVSDRLGGHIVQGHVDGTGKILQRTASEHWEVVRVSLPGDLGRYVVQKGSITVDGISLTVVEAHEDWFSVSLIPTTLELTTLGTKEVGDPVNLEVDVVAKYVERLLKWRTA